VPKGLPTAVIVLSIALLGLTVPLTAAAARAHIVQPGETLYRIALRYGLPVNILAQANRLADPALIHAGQVLTIPEIGSRERQSPTNQSIQPRGVQSPKGVRTHTVRSGDNLTSVAHRFGVTLQALIELNQLESDALRVGQRLRIPFSGSPRAPIYTRPRTATESRQAALAGAAPHIPVGTEMKAPRPLRVHQGPRTYFATIALVAAETPLRITGEDPGWYQVQLPNDLGGWVREEDLRPTNDADVGGAAGGSVGTSQVVAEALGYLGTPYVWGGHSAGGVDCSGFVYVVFTRHLPNLGRMSSFDYFHAGLPVERGALRPGDLVFFTTYSPGPSHVGIYVGDGKFVHASSALQRVATSSLDEPYYATRYLGGRRLISP